MLQSRLPTAVHALMTVHALMEVPALPLWAAAAKAHGLCHSFFEDHWRLLERLMRFGQCVATSSAAIATEAAVTPALSKSYWDPSKGFSTLVMPSKTAGKILAIRIAKGEMTDVWSENRNTIDGYDLNRDGNITFLEWLFKDGLLLRLLLRLLASVGCVMTWKEKDILQLKKPFTAKPEHSAKRTTHSQYQVQYLKISGLAWRVVSFYARHSSLKCTKQRLVTPLQSSQRGRLGRAALSSLGCLMKSFSTCSKANLLIA